MKNIFGDGLLKLGLFSYEYFLYFFTPLEEVEACQIIRATNSNLILIIVKVVEVIVKG